MNETIIDAVTEKDGETKDSTLPITVGNVVTIAIAGGVKQLASRDSYIIGLGAGLLFGKKAGLKTIGGIVAVGAIMNAASFATGEWHNKK